MTKQLNKKVFDNQCSLISEEVRQDSTKRIYLCKCGFVETLEIPKKSFSFSSYQFGYSQKIEESEDDKPQPIF